MDIKTYSELVKLNTFEDRFNYLSLDGTVGNTTFGFDRYLNQFFYKSSKWRQVRNKVIIRDGACDLGIDGRDIHGRIIIHHMNPISIEDINEESEYLLDPEYLICVTHDTHNAIHYGDENLLARGPIIRKPNDTCPWKQ